MLASTVVTLIRLYPLYCTLYYCSLTHQQPSAPVALSSAFVSDFCYKFYSVHSIGFNFHSTFSLAISFRNQQLFPKFIFFPVGSKQRATTMLNFEHVTCCSQFFPLFFCTVSTLFALTFVCVSYSSHWFVLFQTCHISVNLSILLPYNVFQFLLFLGRVPNKPLDFANFFWPCKYDSWRFDLSCRCSSNCSG